MSMPGPLNAAEPVTITADGGTVTLVDGSTFFLSSNSGDVDRGTPHGLFIRDARVLSRWELRLDGQVPQSLSVVPTDAYAARFVLRRAPQSGQADSTLLIVRERVVADGLRETIVLRNLNREPTVVNLTLAVVADFADLFAVKEGRFQGTGALMSVAGGDVLLRSSADESRGLRVSASGQPTVSPGVLAWRVVVPANGRWSTEILAQPVVSGHQIEFDGTGPVRKLSAWRERATSITIAHPVMTEVLRRTESDLGSLQIHDPSQRDRPYVAAGAPWFMTLFGRDSLLTSWMMLPLDNEVPVGTLQTLASLQGRTVDPFTEEEPGRILHEVRLGPDSTAALGGSHYYGTADATPLFVMLLAECWRWGADESVVRGLLPAADAALTWIEQYGDRDGDGFVEYQRATDRGLVNQGWKDSFDGINDANGVLAESPVALSEVQGYVYAAWLARADLADAFGDKRTAEQCRAKAAELRIQFNERFWLPDRGWYAVALDGRKRPIDALASNQAHCLWTRIVDDEHVSDIVKHFAGPDMDSGFGLRTLATTMGAYNPVSYHNGSIWPHDTAIAVAGLMRYSQVPGAVETAQRLASGLVDAAATFSGRLPELFCGFSRTEFESPIPYPTSCSPQAWASAAPLLLIRAFLGLEPDTSQRRISVRPQLPEAWGTVRLRGLQLGSATVDIVASGQEATVEGLPDGWSRE